MGDTLQPGDPGNPPPSRPSGAFPFRPAAAPAPTPAPVTPPAPIPGPPPTTGGAPSGGQLSIKDLMAQRAQAAAAPPEAAPPPPSVPLSYAPPPPAAAAPIAPPPFPAAAPAPLPPPPPFPGATTGSEPVAAPPAPYSYAPAPAQTFNDDDVLYMQHAPQSVVTPLSVGASGGAAFAGMTVWALIIMVLQVEVGWIAWLLGWGIGAASNYSGGRGRKMGWICAGFAALAIVFGRYVGLVLLSLTDPSAMLFSSNTPEVHDPSTEFAVRTMDETGDTLQRAVMGETPAQEYQRVRSKEDLKEFMLRNGYTVGETADEVTDEEIADFKDKIEPGLLGEVAPDPSRGMPDIDTSVPRAGGAGGMSPWQVYWDHWGPHDLLFWFLGIGGAFYFGGRRDGE